MSSFFYQQAQIMMARHIDSYPLLKLRQVLDWQPIEQLLHQQKTRYLRDHRGRPAYPLLSIFKAVLLGQWHSLSDPQLERCLATRLDFYFFCGFDDIALPDHSTLCRFRNWLAQDDTLARLLKLINRNDQLTVLMGESLFCKGLSLFGYQDGTMHQARCRMDSCSSPLMFSVMCQLELSFRVSQRRSSVR